MADLATRTAPVPAEPASFDGVTIALGAPLARYSLRARDGALLGKLLGRKLPGKIGQTSDDVLCLGPDEWLLRVQHVRLVDPNGVAERGRVGERGLSAGRHLRPRLDQRLLGSHAACFLEALEALAGGLLVGGGERSSHRNELDQDVIEITDNFSIRPYAERMGGRSLLRPYSPRGAIPMTNCTGMFRCPLDTWGLYGEGRKLIAQAWDPGWRCLDLAGGAGLEPPDYFRGSLLHESFSVRAFHRHCYNANDTITQKGPIR